ncbi:MAG TPA: 4-(cytidine 5'-diphospho)-2-C-methyl-D-erythritol kinase [Chloroflexota bacterium]|nr:4-(cytidine 5'-diphospho)-2-C-methyl-D-erythritol kinase [Chloroflexota bacterium]
MPSISILAPAKINLTLEVLGRRPDGFHALRSVMQVIALADRLTVEPADTLTLTCSLPELESAQNLVWRAAELLRRETGTAAGAMMNLQKAIPVAAGLGGGSSDAASALLALDRLWDLRLPRGRLLELGARLGSDVPFFLGETGCALVEGRGELLSPLPDLAPRWVVLVRPPQPLSTAAVFGALPPARWSDGARTGAWIAASEGGRHVPPPFNDLEPVALELAPAARAARDALRAAGGEALALSGTGPTVFALFEEEAPARVAFARLGERYAPGKGAFLSRFGSLTEA